MEKRPNLKSWLRDLVNEVPVQMASVMLLDPDSDELEVFGSYGFREAPDLILPRGTGVAGQVVEEGEPRIVNDVTADPNFVESEYDTRQLLVVPIFDGGDPVGTVNLSNPKDKRVFDEEDRNAVEEFLREQPIDYKHYVG